MNTKKSLKRKRKEMKYWKDQKLKILRLQVKQLGISKIRKNLDGQASAGWNGPRSHRPRSPRKWRGRPRSSTSCGGLATAPFSVGRAKMKIVFFSCRRYFGRHHQSWQGKQFAKYNSQTYTAHFGSSWWWTWRYAHYKLSLFIAFSRFRCRWRAH